MIREPNGWILRGGPMVMQATERLVLDCTCAVYVGRRFDDGEAALIAWPCKADGHRENLGRFLASYHESLERPTDRDALDVATEILEEMCLT